MNDYKIPKELREQLTIQARRMRINPTEAEAVLWTKLRGNQLEGLKFRR